MWRTRVSTGVRVKLMVEIVWWWCDSSRCETKLQWVLMRVHMSHWTVQVGSESMERRKLLPMQFIPVGIDPSTSSVLLMEVILAKVLIAFFDSKKDFAVFVS